MAVPTVTSLDPASGPAGTLITLTGTGFTEDTSVVMFGAVSAGTRFSVVSGTEMIAYAPAGSGTVSVKVTTPDGAGIVGSSFTYDTYIGPPGGGGGSAPTVTSVVPSTAVDNDGGDVIVVNGTNFTTALLVLFGENLAQFTVTSDTALSVTTPAGSGVVDVVVGSIHGTSATSAGSKFTYPVGIIPTITSFTPTSAGEWVPITITGTGFWTATGLVNVSGVTFTGAGATEIPAVFRATSATTLVAYVPEDTVTGPIKVYSEAGSATSGTFTCLGTVYDFVQATANGKNAVHYSTYPTGPGSTANLAGDIWYQYGTDAQANVVKAQWVGAGGTTWTPTTLNNLVVTSMDAGAITSGYISAARINALGAITAGGRISSGSAYIDNGVINGATVQTAESGQRVVVTNAYGGIGYIWLYPPTASTNPGAIATSDYGLHITSTFSGGYKPMSLIASTVAITGNLAVDSDLTVTGSIKPGAWSSAFSDDGIWIQDRNGGGPWKLVFNSGVTPKKLSVARGSTTYSVALA